MAKPASVYMAVLESVMQGEEWTPPMLSGFIRCCVDAGVTMHRLEDALTEYAKLLFGIEDVTDDREKLEILLSKFETVLHGVIYRQSFGLDRPYEPLLELLGFTFVEELDDGDCRWCDPFGEQWLVFCESDGEVRVVVD